MTPLPVVLVRLLCLHCRRRRVRLSGGGALRLCWECYYHNLAARERYRRQRHATADHADDCGLPQKPTAAPPGSAERIEVLASRAAQRLRLHHPQDATQRYVLIRRA